MGSLGQGVDRDGANGTAMVVRHLQKVCACPQLPEGVVGGQDEVRKEFSVVGQLAVLQRRAVKASFGERRSQHGIRHEGESSTDKSHDRARDFVKHLAGYPVAIHKVIAAGH